MPLWNRSRTAKYCLLTCPTAVQLSKLLLMQPKENTHCFIPVSYTHLMCIRDSRVVHFPGWRKVSYLDRLSEDILLGGVGRTLHLVYRFRPHSVIYRYGNCLLYPSRFDRGERHAKVADAVEMHLPSFGKFPAHESSHSIV